MSARLELHALGFQFPNQTNLFADINATYGTGLHGLVGDNGVGKTMLLRLIAGQISPTSGYVIKPENVAYVSQHFYSQTLADVFHISVEFQRLQRIEQGHTLSDDLDKADWTLLARIEDALSGWGLSSHPLSTSTDRISGGEKMKAKLAAAFFHQPDLLLLDEPTNNLDDVGKSMLLSRLSDYRGIAIVASHDRDFLRHVHTISLIEKRQLQIYVGGYDCFLRLRTMERERAQYTVENAAKALQKSIKQMQKIDERQRRRSKVGQAKRMHNDQPKIAFDRAKNRSEQSSGQIEKRRAQTRDAGERLLQKAKDDVAIKIPVTVRLVPSGLATSKRVLVAANLNGGNMNGEPIIRNFNLTINGPERVRIEGRNGAGKTTLLKLLTGILPPLAGTATLLVRHAVLDQDLTLLDDSKSVMENFNRLNPDLDRNNAYRALARLGFRDHRTVEIAGELSGGERMRLALACTIGTEAPPQLLILDEPTNHLDLAAIEALESGLADYDGALLIVSHDKAFIQAVCPTRRVDLNERPSAKS